MAEVVAIAGIAATVVQLVQFSGIVLTTGYGFLSKVSKAPSELRELLAESAGLDCVLGQLQSLTDSLSVPNNILQSLQQLGVFKDCQESLITVKRCLDTCEQASGKDIKNFGHRLRWPFKERETKEAIQRLNRLHALISSAVDANSALALQRIETEQNNLHGDIKCISTDLNSYVNQEDFARILTWLCPPASFTAYETLDSALELQCPGTSTWFMNSPTYHQWVDHRNRLLWITGLPGSGKTVLCSAIIKHLQTSLKSPSVVILFYFCDHKDQNRMSLKKLVMNLAKQIVRSSTACANHARQLYREKTKDRDDGLNASEYLSLIRTCFGEFERVIIVVDALDEASEKGGIVESLADMLRTSGKTSASSVQATTSNYSVNVLLTSRESIGTRARRILESTNPLRLSTHESTQDVNYYVKTDLATRITSGKLKLRNKDLGPQICDTVIGRAGTFLQAKLQLDIISSLTNDKAIRIALQKLPNGLSATYENILLTTLKRHPTDIADIKTVLQWLVASSSPLSVSQLAEIVSMSPEDISLDFDAISTDPEDVIEPISQIIILDGDMGERTVRFSHYSVDEYLQSHEITAGPANDFYIDVEEAHTRAAETCLQYLSLSDFDIYISSEEVVHEMMRKYPLLKYAASNWATHLRRSNLSEQAFHNRILPRLGWFLDVSSTSNVFQTWQFVLKVSFPLYRAGSYPPLLFAILEGLHHVVDILLPQLSDINRSFPGDLTCLTVAASNNQVSIAKKLLDRGANVNQSGRRLLTPLHIATENGFEDMVELLLAAGAAIHARSDALTTPFFRAARGGSVKILRLLHDKGSEIDSKTYDHWTPLMAAVERGHARVVKLLLGWGADPSIRNINNMDPLRFAHALSYTSIEAMLKEALDAQKMSSLVRTAFTAEDRDHGQLSMFTMAQSPIASPPQFPPQDLCIRSSAQLSTNPYLSLKSEGRESHCRKPLTWRRRSFSSWDSPSSAENGRVKAIEAEAVTLSGQTQSKQQTRLEKFDETHDCGLDNNSVFITLSCSKRL